MRQLILKDFAIQKKSMPVYLSLAALFFLFYYTMGDLNLTAIMMPVFIVAYSFTNRSLAEDERNHTLRLLVSLPLYRNQLVRAKYASVSLVVFPLFLLFAVVGYAFGLKVPGVDESDPNGFGVVALFMSLLLLTFMVIMSVYLPLVYKLGYIKAQTINRFVILFIFAIGAGAGALLSRLAKLYGDKGTPGWLEDLVGVLERMNLFVLSAMIIAIALILFLLSMLVSMRLFERKQLF